MSYRMFLDDERLPSYGDYIICRSALQAKKYIYMYGIPEFISFDHDLGEKETGYDIAKLIIDIDLLYDNLPDNFSFQVHSQNPIGKENIEKLLNRYLKYKRESK